MKRGLVLALLAAAGGCSVDGSFLDTELFPCEGPSDCGASWSCLRATPYAADFCAPDCGDACDGVCVTQGDAVSCLKGCRILDDNSTSECQSEDYDCIRVSAQADDGICYPVDGCNTASDCGSDEECLAALAEVFIVGGGGLRVDNLYCVPSPEDARDCPPRSVHTDAIFSDAGFRMCVPVCDATDSRCPPGFGCLTQLAGITGQVACIPGIYGIPCDDDTNCMLGSCVDTGSAGRFCTTTCDDADRLALGCENISAPLNLLGLRYRLQCDPAAGGGVGGGLCVPRYEIGIACTPESDTFACADGLECTSLAEGVQTICTKDCLSDGECNQVGRSRNNFCSTIADVCSAQSPSGVRCLRDGNCLNNLCLAGRCACDTDGDCGIDSLCVDRSCT